MNALDLQRIFHFFLTRAAQGNVYMVRVSQLFAVELRLAPEPWLCDDESRNKLQQFPAPQASPVNGALSVKKCPVGHKRYVTWSVEDQQRELQLIVVLKMVFNFMKASAAKPSHTLGDLALGESGILGRLRHASKHRRTL